MNRRKTRKTTGILNSNPPADTKLICLTLEKIGPFDPPKTISENTIYTVIKSFSYPHIIDNNHRMVQVVIINNDLGNKIKVNLNRFKIWNK